MTSIVSKVKSAINDNHVVVFNLMISCMSAERQIDVNKLGVDIDTLPSDSRKLVQERIFPKDFLNNYSRLRDRANAVLDKGAAVRVELGVVSSRSEAVSKIEELNAIKAEWAQQIKTDSLSPVRQHLQRTHRFDCRCGIQRWCFSYCCKHAR